MSRALGDPDAAGSSFGETGNAFVEVDIPPLDATRSGFADSIH
ncbi:MAG: hypothetical protein WCB58_18660 [Acidobacteriaceae bacterium]